MIASDLRDDIYLINFVNYNRKKWQMNHFPLRCKKKKEEEDVRKNMGEKFFFNK